MDATDLPTPPPGSIDPELYTMNESFDDATTRHSYTRKEDADTCRICRGEGSAEEPLFYPCKCSGSIKFVHQDCLMEWLSHSQKKYCELCKTPFHFTKLYSPHMPKKLPTSVFLGKAVLHILSHLWTWLRGLIVGGVWLICVPWVMRCVWRIMFWIGDAGWARDSHYILPLLSASPDNSLVTAGGHPGNSPALNSTVELPFIANITFQAGNLSDIPFIFRLARGILTTMTAPLRRSDPLTAKGNVTVNPLVSQMLEQSQSSILSDVHVLRTLSPLPHVNRFIMDVLEGQIITLSVVVVCILVFLIREWVVQQQPVVDLAAADADNALAQAGGVAQNPDGARDENEERVDLDQVNHGNPHTPPQETNIAQDTDPAEQYEQIMRDLLNLISELETARSMMRTLEIHLDGDIDSLPSPLRERIQDLVDKNSILEQKILATMHEQQFSLDDLTNLAPTEGSVALVRDLFEKLKNSETDTLEGEQDSIGSSAQISSRPRPVMPARGRSFIATDIARSMEEGSLDGSPMDRLDESDTREQDEDGDDSNGSWQQVSELEHVRHRSRSQREESSNSHVHPRDGDLGAHQDATFAEEDGPEMSDGLSWASTTESTEDQAANDDPLPENPFSSEGNSEAREGEANQSQESVAILEPDEFAGQYGVFGRLVNWFWGDIQPAAAPQPPNGEEFVGADDEQVVENIADEAPFVAFEGAQPVHGEHQAADPAFGAAAAEETENENPVLPRPADADVAMAAAAAAAAGGDLNALDADAMEDAEDLEGILELIGMQGPLAGLIQNAVFSSILISLSIALCVFVPYVWGKLVLLHIAEPSLFYKVPLKTATVIADLAIDASLTIAGFLFYGIFQLYRLSMMVLSINIANRKSYQFVLDVHKHAKGALDRLIGGVASTNEIEAGDFLYLSMACHAALYAVEDWAVRELGRLVGTVQSAILALFSPDAESFVRALKEGSVATIDIVWSAFQAIFSVVKAFYTTGSIPVSMGSPLVVPDDPMLTYWNARDRALAILAGYAAVAFICAVYVKIAPITTSTRGRRVESYIVEACLQAGGVLKVILIISIEMIAFPLFCGFLLDFALMPLFEMATFSSRLAFTLTSPWTSGFVHWFVGTCYMFHFALFVSMCRRILRTGVLYFIRDPDDPTFHPVRDVLERNVITQLRKIAFSAIVYGALIIVCLGGIVWGLWAASDSVLPIHWSSTGSNIEFPLDILFYNFLTPFVVHYAKPSAGITAMYGWWFRKAARALRLSDFLFRDKQLDEEGHWIRHTWKAWCTRRTNHDLTEEDVDRTAIAEGKADPEALDDGIVRFVPDGRYVRAPASDQVRIPKGTPVFVPVDSENKRLDGKPDDEGVHASSSNLVAKVYIPPWFKVRIGFFIVAVWLFAAATGICVTILPLLFGRRLLSSAFGPKEFINDIYAFSLGVYILGGALYAGIHREVILNWLRNTFIPADNVRRMLVTTWNATKRIVSLLYVYSTLAIGLPLINAVLLEVYILMPMHYFFDASEHHVMHLVQDWTLGILYVRIGMRIFLFDPESRPARAIRQVFANGYLNPDARRATRFFILPALLAFAILMAGPFLSAVAINKTYMRYTEDQDKIAVMRLAYPIASAIALCLFVGRKTTQAAGRWRARIRDEVYLVGERLHNFGERRANKGKGKAGPRPSDIVAL